MEDMNYREDTEDLDEGIVVRNLSIIIDDCFFRGKYDLVYGAETNYVIASFYEYKSEEQLIKSYGEDFDFTICNEDYSEDCERVFLCLAHELEDRGVDVPETILNGKECYDREERRSYYRCDSHKLICLAADAGFWFAPVIGGEFYNNPKHFSVEHRDRYLYGRSSDIFNLILWATPGAVRKAFGSADNFQAADDYIKTMFENVKKYNDTKARVIYAAPVERDENHDWTVCENQWSMITGYIHDRKKIEHIIDYATAADIAECIENCKYIDEL